MLELTYLEAETTLVCTFSGPFRGDDCPAVSKALEEKQTSVGGG